jgi:amino acid transporter
MGFTTYIAVEVQRAGQRSRQLLSMVGGGAIQIAFLLVSLYAFYHAVGENFAISAAAGNQTAGIASFPYYAALATGNPALAIVIAIAFTLWTIPLINLFTTIMQRCMFAWSFERLLPSWVARVNGRTHTPVVAIALAAALAIAGAAFNAYNANFATALTLATFPSFVMIFVLGLSAVVMPYRRRALYEGSAADLRIAGVPLLVIVGACSMVVMAFFMALPFFYQQQVGLKLYAWLPWATAIAPIAVIGIGIVWWYIARAVNASKGIDLNLIYKTIPPD